MGLTDYVFGLPDVNVTPLTEDSPAGPKGCYTDSKLGAFVTDADSGDGIKRTTEQCEAWAKQLGCKLIYPQCDELFVDIDGEEAGKQFQHVWPVVKRHFAHRYKVTPSKSGLPKRHVVVQLVRNDHSLLEKIGLQAALGSDGRREALSLLRASRNEKNVVIFFEKDRQHNASAPVVDANQPLSKQGENK